jgi:hypothetical protein
MPVSDAGDSMSIGLGISGGRLAAIFGAAALAAVAFQAPAQAEDIVASLPAAPAVEALEEPPISVVARIDLSEQHMYVYVNDVFMYRWPVSTARARYVTPRGFYKAEWLSRYHRSRKYDWAPMPWSVFFYKGYAIHGTTEIKRLGRPASHGCVRLHPDNAKVFFELVKLRGLDQTLISVVR